MVLLTVRSTLDSFDFCRLDNGSQKFACAKVFDHFVDLRQGALRLQKWIQTDGALFGLSGSLGECYHESFLDFP